MKESGIGGTVSIAEPLDACSLLTNEIVASMNGTRYPFVLIIRGGCSFEDKVRRAQAAGFEAAIVYDNDTTDLLPSNLLFFLRNSDLMLFSYDLNLQWLEILLV